MKVTLCSTALAVCAALAWSVPSHAAVLLSEDFEGFTLASYVSPTETNAGVSKGDGTDWTDQLPAGWASSIGATPVGSPIEFQGWRIHDVDSWIATEGNQDRNLWTRGGVGAHGSVLLVDPDAYDDGTEIDTGLFNVTITTPPINLSTLVPGSVSLSVDSYIRTETTSDQYIHVSYNGGVTYEATALKSYLTPALADDTFLDEHLVLPVNNPANGSLVFKFSLLEGSNDWWWAIDNVEISGQRIPEPATLALGGLAAIGLVAVARRKRRAA